MCIGTILAKQDRDDFVFGREQQRLDKEQIRESQQRSKSIGEHHRKLGSASMTLIMLFLTIAAVCIGVALCTIGSTYIGISLALVGVAVGTISAVIQYPFDGFDLSDRSEASGDQKERLVALLFAGRAFIVPTIIGAVMGAAMFFLMTSFHVVPNGSRSHALSLIPLTMPSRVL